MHLLSGALRTYAWGSRTAIAALCGRPVPSDHPEAELWLGSHPADPARLLTDDGSRSLLDAIDADPAGQLGDRARTGFGDRLPFLLKLLAAEEPLSLQAHPSAEQAKEGFLREEADGIALDSPERNYRDDSHKPELVVALTRFEALAGFRDPHRTVELLRALDVPELAHHIELLAGQPDSAGLRALFTTWITLPQPALGALLPRILDGCVRYLAAAPGAERPFANEVRTVLGLGESYPGDAGVLASLLLNRVTLEPGEGLYLDAGNLHAYLHGLAVEMMANSDNVLRGGLTPKHVDVPELLRVLDFEPLTGSFLLPAPVPGTGMHVYDTPAPEFSLARVDLARDGVANPAAVEFDASGPRILLCTSGSVTIRGGDDTLVLDQGDAAWIAASDPVLTASASTPDAQLFSASVG
ncbi:mannose-6-phosphate isomerase, class I [Rhodococcus tukisamuensis]|uniref:mannose-6-phosphate isomerase n=1 Tax=Rhodococcus tukisamuensis TaxID=168276 RepID=A0A1G6YF02_9NOCA|nr:mannose-6-phosphate isomerase, class I [Rhodococcus tukisamuensis]SDD88851.1 mannose-6-phosphate isomerase [Rhodococcus tukisamuensis]